MTYHGDVDLVRSLFSSINENESTAMSKQIKPAK
jgi:hypothetical protein